MAKIIDELTVKINMAPCLDDNQLGLLKMLVDQEIANVRGRASPGYTARVVTLKKTLDEAYKNRINRTDIEDRYWVERAKHAMAHPEEDLTVEETRDYLSKEDKMSKLPYVGYNFDSLSITTSPPASNGGSDWVAPCLDLKRQIDELKQTIENKETKSTCSTEKQEVKASRIYKSVTYTTSFEAENLVFKGSAFNKFNVRMDYNVCLDDNARYFVVNVENPSSGECFKSVLYKNFSRIRCAAALSGHFWYLQGIGWNSRYPHECAIYLCAPEESDRRFLLSDETYALLKSKHSELKSIADDEVRRHVHG